MRRGERRRPWLRTGDMRTCFRSGGSQRERTNSKTKRWWVGGWGRAGLVALYPTAPNNASLYTFHPLKGPQLNSTFNIVPFDLETSEIFQATERDLQRLVTVHD